MVRIAICICCAIACLPLAQGQREAVPVQEAKISLPDPAYIGMPIWMEITSPSGFKIRYPSSTTPNDFYCNEVQVRQNERLLPSRIGAPPEGRGGAPCGALGVAGIAESRLPIHLQYPLTEPGTYMVRFIRHEYQPPKPGTQIVAEQSDWVPLHVRAAPPGMVEDWLTRQLATVPASPGRLLGDFLPSLLASRDPRVLRLMIDLAYRSCPGLRWSCPDSYVAAYASNSLALFDHEQVRSQLLSSIRARGPSDALGYWFSSRGNIVAPVAPQIAAAALPYLHSSDPVQVEAAVHILYVLRDPYFHLSTEMVAQINTVLLANVDLVIAQRNDNAAFWIAMLIGNLRPSDGRRLLWKMADAGLTTEQSLSCITWFHDPADLPRLAGITKQYNPADPQGREHSSMVMQLQTQYGTAARPYLRDILAASKQVWVRTAAAQGLARMNDRAGWEFFLDVLRQGPFYRDEMVRWLRDNFPAIRSADNAAIISFLDAKVASAAAP